MSAEFQDPYGIVVLLQNDLVVVDLTSPGYPCFENPYPMDLHGSPVTSCTYLADCPGDLVPALYSVGTAKQNRCALGRERREGGKGGVERREAVRPGGPSRAELLELLCDFVLLSWDVEERELGVCKLLAVC